MSEIIYVGEKNCGAGAYRSLWKFFDRIYILKDSADVVLSIRRECDELIDDFDSVECRYVFVEGYEKLIAPEKLARKLYINLHGAILPKWRGMHAKFYAIMNGEKELGLTFHLMNQFMDDGDIIAVYKFEYHGQTIQEINNEMNRLIEENAGRLCSEYIAGKIHAVPQDRSNVFYGARRNYDDCLIDFSMSNEMLGRYFRALTRPYPLPMLLIRGEKYECLDHVIIDRSYYGPTGRAVNADDSGVWIKTSEGFLVIQNVQKLGTDKTERLRDIIPLGYRFMHKS